jgi:hypothetical protein
MKTFQQFCEDAASDYERGMIAYSGSPRARLAARRSAAAERSRTAASNFAERSKQKMQAQKERNARIRQDYKERTKKD